jgi:outer membrane receptor protein involved in Fe transport
MPEGIELRLGADSRRTSGESRELFNYLSGNISRRFAGGETWTAGAYGEATADVGRLTLTAGGRLDHWQVSGGHLFESVVATNAVLRDVKDPNRGGWLPTGRGGAVLSLGSGWKLRSAAYLGWRMPTLNELFRPFRAGSDVTAANPDLKPERLAGAEGGAEYDAGGVSISLTAFANRLRNAIANVTRGVGPGTFEEVGFVPAGGRFLQRENIDAVNVRGVEASAGWARGPWSIRAGASLTHARVETSGIAAPLDGRRPAQTPNFAATLAGGWEQGGKGVQLVLRRVGAQFEDDLNTRTLHAATTVDAYASWPLTRRLLLVARGENLTDKLIEAGINGDGSVERATPRTLWLGLRLR